MTAPAAYTTRQLIERMVQLGAHPIKLKRGIKKPSGTGWTVTPALTVDEADEHVAGGGNLGVHLGSSRFIAFDCEDQAATDAVVAAGFALTVAPAKRSFNGTLKPGLEDPDSGKQNRKLGGSHIWLRVPDGVDPTGLSSERAMQLKLPNGGIMDVLAGPRYVVAPPSALDLAYGAQYVPFTGSPLDVSSGGELPGLGTAPMWLFDLAVPCPPELAPLHGCLIPIVREQVEQSARSAELSAQIDEVPWSEWIAGDHRIMLTGEVDGCGCDIGHYMGASHGKSVTLHDGCEQGNGAHIWSGTMLAELGLPGEHVSRLDLAVALRKQSRHDVAAAQGIQLGQRDELGSVWPANYERIADHFERRGETARAAMYRRAAANMAATMPTPEQRGETFIDGPVLGGLPPRFDSQGTAGAAPPIGTLGGSAAPPISNLTSGPMQHVPIIESAVGGAVPPAFGAIPAAEVAYTRAPDPGPFPVDALPEVLRKHAEWVMYAVNVPASMVGPMYLPVLSAACNRAVITPRVGWTEEGCPLWGIIIAPPSSRKSPTLSKVDAPIKSAQRLLRERTEAARRRSEFDAEALEEAAQEAKKKYQAAVKEARTSGPTRAATPAPVDTSAAGLPPVIGTLLNDPLSGDPEVAALRAAYEQLEQEAREARAEVPGRAVLSFEDATDAAMQDLMSDCDGYGFLIATEASTWFNAMIREDSTYVTPGNYLKAYSSEDFKVFRVSRGEVWVEDPYLPMLHIIQPDPLRAALKPDRDGHSRLLGNGAWARFGVSYVEDVDPDEWDKPIPDGTVVEAAYNSLIEREFLRSYGRKELLRFELAEQAKPLMGAIYNRVERIIHAQRSLPGGVGMAEEWGKTCGRMLRIARVFRQVELTDEEIGDADRTHLIGHTNLRDAWRITEWMMASQAYAMGGAKADSDDDLVAKAVTWLRKRLAADGAVEYRKLYANKTHRPYLQQALDQLSGDEEITVTEGPISNATVTPTEKLAAAA
ncbi:DUF3987 domain-containing protein [Mycolicibacterium senegalense]|uniref:DUF3987 domain-containing protein n=1 Tax=Mycolicibacterium senegalense TaxID=1796 RepID=UPI003AAF9ED8